MPEPLSSASGISRPPLGNLYARAVECVTSGRVIVTAAVGGVDFHVTRKSRLAYMPMRDPSGADASQTESAAGRLSRRTIEAVKRRDSVALGEFFDAHFDRLFGYAYRLLGDRSAAEEVTQDLFLKVYKAAHRIDPERDPGPWMMTIARNACREYWRKRGRRVEGHARSLDADPMLKETTTNGRADPERAAISSQRANLLQRALMKLREPFRSVVVLYDIEGMTHKEIAGLLKTTPAAVRKRYSRALSQLRNHLRGALK